MVIRNGVWRQGVEDLQLQFHVINGWLESLREKCFDPNTDEL
jgi:hypothetical protein